MSAPVPSAARPRALAALLPPVLVFLGITAVWQVAVRLLELPAFLLPAPTQIARTAVLNASALASATAVTAGAALAGFLASALIGSLISFAFSQSLFIRRACFPYAIFLQTVPIVAIAPLIIIWFGTGFHSVVLVAFIVSLFPVITNATTGLTTIDRNLLDLFRLYDASRPQTLWKLRLPAAVPYLVAGLKTSSGLAVIGAIVGEFFAGYGAESRGLGYLIIVTSAQLKTAYLFAAVFCATLLGLLLFSVVGQIGARVLNHWYREQTHD